MPGIEAKACSEHSFYQLIEEMKQRYFIDFLLK